MPHFDTLFSCMQEAKELAKAYDPKDHEDQIYKEWIESGIFNPDTQPNVDSALPPFSMVLPPPNVTGTLHMGHAVMLAIEDAMARFARLQGRKTLWLPGTDHASIATESKVEKMMIEKEGTTRHDLGREAFLKRVDQFAQESHDTIVGQMKKMGASVDWSREAFTLDAKRNEAVNEAFKRMFEDGLIYKGHRVVNWDPTGQTTVSDDEVEHKEVNAKLYTFTYSKDFPIAIATTRPETKVGDTAVAVHPEGKWKEYIGQTFEIADFAGKALTIKVVGDEHVEEAFGTGALGVTPAHSVTDDEIARTHTLPSITVIGRDGRMTKEAGPLVAGQTTLEARETIAGWLREQGLLEKEEDTVQNLSVAQRSGGAIEPLPMEQWFIDVNKPIASREGKSLKQLMIDAVRGGSIEILPDRFEKTYFHWIDNLRDWNISRQIWYGHRVPVWTKDGEMKVAEASPGEGWTQDLDTLDTWFSSGLWTFSTLGWPERTDDLKTYHPTSVLETGYDILFFWVARMILMSTYLLGEVPFKTVYLHGLVRDEQGRKMSKSLGNIINPLDMIEKYGADATRLSLLVGATPGNDMKLSEDKIAGFRNFTNKLWNISRFVFMTAGSVKSVQEMPEPVTLADKWILNELAVTMKKATAHYEAFEYSQLGELLREFTWNKFADWYVEVAKTQAGERTNAILLFVLERILLLWHPFMPFVTEALYKEFGNGSISTQRLASFEYSADEETLAKFTRLQDAVTFVRNTRARYTIAYTTPLTLVTSADVFGEEEKAVLALLAKVGAVEVGAEVNAKEATQAVSGAVTFALPLSGIVDFDAEKARTEKELARLEKFITTQEAQLQNEGFVKNAKPEVIEERKASVEKAKADYQTLKNELN